MSFEDSSCVKKPCKCILGYSKYFEIFKNLLFWEIIYFCETRVTNNYKNVRLITLNMQKRRKKKNMQRKTF